LKGRYNIPVGLSDHSGKIFPSLSAVSLGAEILEFHTVFDRRMFGPDTASSLTIDEIKHLVEGVRFIETSLQSPIDKTDNTQFNGLKNIFEKSLAINKDKLAGDILNIDDLEAKKPFGYGIPAKDYANVIGKKLISDKSKWDFLKEGDYE